MSLAKELRRVYLNLQVTVVRDLPSQPRSQDLNAIDDKADVVKLGQCATRRKSSEGFAQTATD